MKTTFEEESAEQETKRQNEGGLADIVACSSEICFIDGSKVDLYTASLYNGIGLPVELFTPIFAISRTVGWTSHIFEQWSNNRLIRPRAEYTGATGLHYCSIEERSR